MGVRKRGLGGGKRERKRKDGVGWGGDGRWNVRRLVGGGKGKREALLPDLIGFSGSDSKEEGERRRKRWYAYRLIVVSYK